MLPKWVINPLSAFTEQGKEFFKRKKEGREEKKNYKEGWRDSGEKKERVCYWKQNNRSQRENINVGKTIKHEILFLGGKNKILLECGSVYY